MKLFLVFVFLLFCHTLALELGSHIDPEDELHHFYLLHNTHRVGPHNVPNQFLGAGAFDTIDHFKFRQQITNADDDNDVGEMADLFKKVSYNTELVPSEEIVIRLKDLSTFQAIATDYGLTIREVSRYCLYTKTGLVENNRYNENMLQDLVTRMTNDDRIVYAHFQNYEQLKPARSSLHRVSSDPQRRRQWHLGKIHVEDVWNQGYTGEGIQVGVVDNGINGNHPEFSGKFNTQDSFDFTVALNHNGMSSGPHGTACAGLIAAKKDNNVCGVGVAYDAKVTSLRVIQGRSFGILPFNKAQALSFALNHNDIYSASIGSGGCGNDRFTELPPEVLNGLLVGTYYGRDFKGAIYSFAAGNEARCGGYSTLDQLLSSRFPITVAAAGDNNKRASYSNPGSVNFVTAPSSGGSKKIYTTGEVGSECRDNFGGTSAATPIVSGVIALMLQADPKLGWRDVKDIIARTSQKIDSRSSSWKTNAAGLHVSHAYGFGMIRADNAITEVLRRKEANSYLGTEKVYESSRMQVNAKIPDESFWAWVDNNGLTRIANVPQTHDMIIEHVIVYLRLNHKDRGDLRIELGSPNHRGNHHCRLLSELRADDNSVGIRGKAESSGFFFGCTQFWGEHSAGEWALKVWDRYWRDEGKLEWWKIMIYGHDAPGVPSQNRIAGYTTRNANVPSGYYNIHLQSGRGFTMTYNRLLPNPGVYCMFESRKSPKLMSTVWNNGLFDSHIRLPATPMNGNLDILTVSCYSGAVTRDSQIANFLATGSTTLDMTSGNVSEPVQVTLDLTSSSDMRPSVTFTWQYVQRS